MAVWPGDPLRALTGDPGKRGLPASSALNMLREDGITRATGVIGKDLSGPPGRMQVFIFIFLPHLVEAMGGWAGDCKAQSLLGS